MSRRTFTLTPAELALTKLLIAAANDKCIVRFAGGFVRDKLVGTKSNDIDVALETIIRKKTNNKTRKRSSNEIEEKSDQQNTEHAKVDNEDETPQVTGELFAKWLQQEIEKTNQVNVSSGADESEPAEAHIASRVATIKTNPAKSKHLETATMRINDFELDIVALRHETYTHSQGRIPKIIPGTPLQDAERRDLTINALFYNLHTGLLEDHVGGLNDLDNRVCRTPIDPKQTFIDDPLRIIRVVRFAARLDFEIEKRTFAEMSNSEVQTYLRDPEKISRERIGTELKKMLLHDNALKAIEILYQAGLFPSVWQLPSDMEYEREDRSSLDAKSIMGARYIHRWAQDAVLYSLIPQFEVRPDWTRILLHMAICLPFNSLRHSLGKREYTAPYIIQQDGLKATANETKIISDACEGVRQLSNESRNLSSLLEDFQLRRTAGNWIQHHGKWWSAVILSLGVSEMTALGATDFSRAQMLEADVISKLHAIFSQVRSLQLEDAWRIKPLVDGKRVMQLCPSMKRGPILGQILKELTSEQFEYPHMTIDEAETWVVRRSKNM